VRYRLEYSEEARHALRDAPGYYRQLFKRAIEGLANDSQPVNTEELREAGYFKIKFGRWRVIYRVRDTDGVVRILRVKIKTGPDTYKDIENL
jgi:mRNA-degrading endonuclease RelE of RelBE toxin-antitoxin system